MCWKHIFKFVVLKEQNYKWNTGEINIETEILIPT